MDKMIPYRYPRTLIETFGCDAETAVAIHGPYRRPLVADTWIGIAVTLVTLGAIIGVLS